MNEIDEKSGSLHRFIGHLAAETEPPTFLIPVFQDLESELFFIQVVSEDNKISRFRLIPAEHIVRSQDAGTLRRIGDDAVFAFALGAQSTFFGPYDQFQEKLRQLLALGMFDKFPAFAHSVATIVGDRRLAYDYKQQIYLNELPSSYRSRKFFLENNVIRDTLAETLPQEYRHFASEMKIDVRGNRINIRLPDLASDEARSEIGRRVTHVAKEFIKTTGVELSFDDSNHLTRQLEFEVQRIKNGHIRVHRSVLDCSMNYNKNLSSREAIAIIPEAANVYYSGRQSREGALSKIVSKSSPIRPLSRVTTDKILQLQPVSLSSAFLFRLWIFLDIQRAEVSPDFILHFPRFRIRRDRHKFIKDHLIARGVVKDNDLLDYLSFPISMIVFLSRHEIIPLQEMRRAFSWESSPIFFYQGFNIGFLREWAKFCDTEFKNLNSNYVDRLSEDLLD